MLPEHEDRERVRKRIVQRIVAADKRRATLPTERRMQEAKTAFGVAAGSELIPLAGGAICDLIALLMAHINAKEPGSISPAVIQEWHDFGHAVRTFGGTYLQHIPTAVAGSFSAFRIWQYGKLSDLIFSKGVQTGKDRLKYRKDPRKHRKY